MRSGAHVRLLPQSTCLSAALLSLSVCLGGCIPYSSYQSARIMEPGASSVTVSASQGHFHERHDDHERQDDEGINEYSLLSRVGSRDPRFDFGFKGSGSFAGRDFVDLVLEGYVRSGLIPRYLTIQMPFSYLLAEGSYTDFYVHPAVIASWPATPGFEINASASSYLGVEGSDSPYSYSLGLAIGGHERNLRLRPEVAWLKGFGGEGSYRQFGLALEFRSPEPSGDEAEDGEDDSIFAPR